MDDNLQPKYMSKSDYLAFERQSEERHEFIDGIVLLKESGGWEHGIITVNTSASLHQKLEDEPCVVVSMQMRLWIEASQSFRYPDIMVICGEPQLTDEHRDNLTNPIVIIEVMSSDSEIADRQTKFNEYVEIESLQEYVLISQHEVRVERYLRDETGEWRYSLVEGLDASLELASINCKIDLLRLYEKTKLNTKDGED